MIHYIGIAKQDAKMHQKLKIKFLKAQPPVICEIQFCACKMWVKFSVCHGNLFWGKIYCHAKPFKVKFTDTKNYFLIILTGTKKLFWGTIYWHEKLFWGKIYWQLSSLLAAK